MTATTRQKKVAGILATMLVIAVLVTISCTFREPGYNGRSLTAWAEQYRANWTSPNKSLATEAKDSIQAIGTNAIPFLVGMVRMEDSALRKRLASIAPSKWHKNLRLIDTSGDVRRTGAYGLGALGTNAQSALSDLIHIAAHHPNEDGRYVAVFAIRSLREAAEPAIPFLIQCLTNDVRIIRDDAALALGTMKLQPQAVVPALTRYLKAVGHTEGWELTDAIWAVARFGTNALPATPLLTKLLYHHDKHIRSEATNALSQIDRQLFANGRLTADAVMSISINRLKAALAFDDKLRLTEAIAILGNLGTNARSAVPLLMKLQDHGDLSVRTAVTNALLEIDLKTAPNAGGTNSMPK